MNLNFKTTLKLSSRKSGAGGLLALDLRRTQLCLCQVNKQGRPALLERFALNADQQVSREAVAELLEKLLREKHLKGSRCISLLHRPDYSLLLTEAPQVPNAEIQAALRWKIADLIDFPINEAVLDWFELPSGPSSEARQVYVVVARESVIQARVDLLRGLGLQPAYIDIADMAQRNLAARLPEDDQGVALLEIGDTESLLTLTRQGELIFSRILSLGAEALLENIILLTGYSAEMAPSAMATHGLDPDPAADAAVQNALRQGVERLALEVQRSMDYYDSRFRRGAVKHLYLSFNNHYVAGMAAYLGTLTGMQCQDYPAIPLQNGTAMRAGLLSYGAALREMLQ